MGVRFNQDANTFILETVNTEYQISVNEIGIVQHLYYGRKTFGQDMRFQNTFPDRGFSGNPYERKSDRGMSLDVLPQEFSGCGVGDYRVSSMSVKAADGSRSCDLRYVSHVIAEEKTAIPGLPSVRQNDCMAAELRIELADEITGLQVSLIYDVFEEKDIITRRAVYKNIGNETLVLEKAASMSIDFPYGEFDLVHFHGRHCMERQMERISLTHDIHTIASRRGMSSHHENPFVILSEKDATEHQGDCYGFMFVYSGNHKIEAEMDQAGSTRVVVGIHDENFSWQLTKQDEFYSPEVILSYSSQGLNALSQNYHKIIRDNVCPPKYQTIRRPVLINNWEATYFRFDTQKILDIASAASELGVEMMVLDDGWFGKRDDDNSGLGDWVVNEKKLPGGLKVIADGVNALGMKFGLWFEPEMINEDSDLYRAHPEWVLADPGRKPMMSRKQMLLDMGNPAVIDYLFDCISKVLSDANIEYVKWDFNRSMANAYSNILPAERQGETAHRFMLGTYSLLERLLKAFPDLMIEGCAGGGGRFDAGMLYYCPQIWCSDDSDAIERLKIQHGTSYGYPISSMGSHVSAVPNHQTGRVASLHTRGVVAMSGTFGYELDLTKLTEDEKDKIRQQIKDFHEYYWLIQKGSYYRLTNPQKDDYYTAWEFAAEDKSEALLNVVVTHVQANPQFPCIRLQGLEETALYQVAGTDIKLTGAALMYGGYVIKEIIGECDPIERGNYPAFQIYFKKSE
ncbi:MAG: alpha-galactosidase [Lachnospiraceae bacterium]|nr:alpha-galactosidase [Lachnospiraceae bacterium]